MLTQQKLHEILAYDAETGICTWRVARPPRGKCGARAGYVGRHGYVSIGIDGNEYRAHRLAWLYVHGVWPTREIDHINGNPSANRLANLRLATTAQNQWNSRPRRNMSGAKGVYWLGRCKRWAARCNVNGKNKYIGAFRTVEEAAQARAKYVTVAHGEFARLD